MWVIVLLKRFIIAFCIVIFLPINTFATEISASSAVVIDADTKAVLYEKNAYCSRSMASTTKIMTALLALESNRLDDVVKIDAVMLDTEGSSLGLKLNDTITLYDLVVGMMLTSGNDSANAVACFLAGGINEFSKLMNDKAKEIGMNNTTFVTPSGLDKGKHHSTAYDMAILTASAIENKAFCNIVSMQSATITISDKSVTVYNHNKLLSMDKDIFGVKTGYTEKAGRCLVSAKKYDKNNIICVTLNAPNDWDDHLNLYKSAEKKYKKYEISDTIDLAVVGADRDTVKCSYSSSYMSLTNVNTKVYIRSFLYAPIKKGDIVGYALVSQNEKIIERLPIEADEDVEYYGFEE